MHAIESTTHRGFTIAIYQDPEPELFDPREYDNLGVMVCFHDRYFLGDRWAEERYKRIAEDADLTVDDIHAHIFADLEATTSHPLFLLDHSGLAMTAGTEPADRTRAFTADPGGWDTSFVGWIFDSAETRKNIGITKPEHITPNLLGEVELYDAYLQGDVLGFIVTDPDGVEVDSCWGYLATPIDDLVSECRAAINAFYRPRYDADLLDAHPSSWEVASR